MWSETEVWLSFSTEGDGCYVVDESCRIVLWNEEAERLLGFGSKETEQRRCYEMIRGQREGCSPLCGPDCAIREAPSRGVSIPSYYLSVRKKDGEKRWLNVSIYLTSPCATPPDTGLPEEMAPIWASNRNAMFASPGRVSYIVHLLRDASQEKRALAFTRQALAFIEKHTGSIGHLYEPPSSDHQPLSKREREVLKLLSGGSDVKMIAGHLSISPYTVRNHLQNILKKLGLHNRLELLIYAFKNYLI